ncbi:MAG: segregation/condensation protein A [Bacillota bacterium]
MEQLTVQLDAFEGPLDVLYHLIEKNKIDIYDIPIAELADQYLAYLDTMEERDMEHMSSFLLMAATLLEIKSKMLLPKLYDDEDDGIDPREELMWRLLEYKKIKDITEDFRVYEEEAAVFCYKGADDTIKEMKIADEGTLEDFLEGVTMSVLCDAFREVMKRKESKIDTVRSGFKSVERDSFTIEEQSLYIKDMIALHTKVNFSEIFRLGARKMEKVVTFLAVLELIKNHEITIVQEDIFSEIVIQKREVAV